MKQGQILCVGFSAWKQPIARRYFHDAGGRIAFVSPEVALEALCDQPSAVCVWGIKDPQDFEAKVRAAQVDFLRMEDGFVRSVGLGSDFVLPSSICVDRAGIYYDGHRPSDLEGLLTDHSFSAAEIERARTFRRDVVALGLTKYNLDGDSDCDARKLANGRRVLLVPGQVPDDASLARGTGSIRTNLDLLGCVRKENPDAFILYKEHPEVSLGNRVGREERAQASSIADLVLTRSTILSCIEICDEVHVLTSLAGFEALLRDKSVVCWGMPFFAGWYLTSDRMPQPRRSRRLTLDELVAGALLLYPLYFDPANGRPCQPEMVLHALAKRKGHDLTFRTPALWRQARRAARWVRLRVEAFRGN